MKAQITNKQKILFPKSKITKEEYVNYYRKIAKWMLPLIKDRPITLERFPEGIKGQIFFQKKVMDYYPKWIKTISVKRQQKTPIKMAIINDLDSLLYIANQVGVIHIWLSKKDKLNIPDRIVFDLDPPKNNFAAVVEAAKDLKKLLDSLKLPSFLMTTGSKGLHVVVPIKREKTFDEVRSFAKKVALILSNQNPKKYTIESRKSKRKKRVFIDYLRNAFAQTHVAPYSIRPIEKAPIATPILWKELSKNLDSQSFNIKNIFKRRSNPFSSLNSKSVSLKNAVKKIEELIK
jgi:bifunctional non-homologous end joining protein LigD